MATERTSRSWVMQSAVVVSILAHASLLCAAGLRQKDEPKQQDLAPPVDVWAGTTSAPVVTEELAEVDLGGSELGGAKAAPSEPSAPNEPSAKAEEKPAPSEPAEPAKPTEKAAEPPVKEKKAERARAERPKTPPSPKTAEEAKPAEKADGEKVAGTPEEEEKDAKPEKVAGTPAEKVAGTPEEKDANAAKVAGTPGEKVAGTSSGRFGAEGAAGVRDLGRAFTRALPPACAADPTWAKLSKGPQGSIEVAVVVDAEGKITGFEPISQNPKPELVGALRRTLALLRAGVFSLSGGGSVTAGRQVLRLSVDLSDTPVSAEEAEHAGAFGLAHEWQGRRGVASFTQSGGRHVEITVEFLRVELAPG